MDVNLDRIGWRSATPRRRGRAMALAGLLALAAIQVSVLRPAWWPFAAAGAGLALWLFLPMALPISGRVRWQSEGPPVVLLAAGLAGGTALLSGTLLSFG